MDWRKKPITFGAICGASIAALPAIFLALTFFIIASELNQNPGVWPIVGVILLAVLYAGVIMFVGALCGAVIGGFVSRLTRRHSRREGDT